MKKIIFLFMGLGLASQVFADGHFTVKGGVSQAHMISGYADKALTGFHLGVGYNKILSEVFSLSSELAFVRRGTGEGLPQVGSLVSSRITVDVLEIPVLLRWHWGRIGRNVQPVFFSGFYGACVLSAKGKIVVVDQSWSENLIADCKRFDCGFLAGAGVEFPLFGHVFLCEMRYLQGFPKLNKIALPQAWKSNSLTLLFGLKL